MDTAQCGARNISRPQFPRTVSDKCSISCLPPVQMTRSCLHWANPANYTNQTTQSWSWELGLETLTCILFRLYRQQTTTNNHIIYVCCLAGHYVHYCEATKHDMFTEGQCGDVLLVMSSPVTIRLHQSFLTGTRQNQH